jgi:hypothetical protein
MLDHLSLRVPVNKVEEVVNFYVTALAPLGIKKIVDTPTFIGFGDEQKPYFSIVAKGETVGNEIHLAFGAKGALHCFCHSE